MELKKVKVFETGSISEETYQDLGIGDLFEYGEDTSTYYIGDDINEDLDDYLITNCGCTSGEKIVIERGSW